MFLLSWQAQQPWQQAITQDSTTIHKPSGLFQVKLIEAFHTKQLRPSEHLVMRMHGVINELSSYVTVYKAWERESLYTLSGLICSLPYTLSSKKTLLHERGSYFMQFPNSVFTFHRIFKMLDCDCQEHILTK